MLSNWTHHLKTIEEKDKFEAAVKRSKPVLARLKTLVEMDIKGTEQAERAPTAYDNPNWQYRQAHVNGYLNAMYKILKLVDLDGQKEKSHGPNSNGTAERIVQLSQ